MEADISKLRKTGHFYFALTCFAERHLSDALSAVAKHCSRASLGSPYVVVGKVHRPISALGSAARKSGSGEG